MCVCALGHLTDGSKSQRVKTTHCIPREREREREGEREMVEETTYGIYLDIQTVQTSLNSDVHIIGDQ